MVFYKETIPSGHVVLTPSFRPIQPISESRISPFVVYTYNRLTFMLETSYRIKYGVRQQNWFILNQVFQDFNNQLDDYMNLDTKQELPSLYIEILLMLYDFFNSLSTTTQNDTMLLFGKNLQNKILEYKVHIDEYKKDLLTTIKEDDKFEVEDEKDYEFEFEDEVEDDIWPWVKDESETALEIIYNKVSAIVPCNGDRDKMDQLPSLADLSVTPAQKLHILTCHIRALFNLNFRLSSHIQIPDYKKCVCSIFQLLDILERYPNIFLANTRRGVWLGNTTLTETMKNKYYKGKIWVTGDLVSFLDRLFYEFYMILEFTDPLSPEYVERRADLEPILFVLSQHILNYSFKKKDYSAVGKTAFLLMEFIYHQSQDQYDKLKQLGEQICLKEHRETPVFPDSCSKLVVDLFGFIQDKGDDYIRTHAMLYYSYHLALMKKFPDAKSILMEYLKHEGKKLDQLSRVHCARAIAQLGLCAFSNGLGAEAYDLLSKIYENGRVEKTLAQLVPNRDSRCCIPKLSELYAGKSVSSANKDVDSYISDLLQLCGGEGDLLGNPINTSKKITLGEYETIHVPYHIHIDLGNLFDVYNSSKQFRIPSCEVIEIPESCFLPFASNERYLYPDDIGKRDESSGGRNEFSAILELYDHPVAQKIIM
ncbi:Ulp1 peptidase [Ranunculus cassubicifolius]